MKMFLRGCFGGIDLEPEAPPPPKPPSPKVPPSRTSPSNTLDDGFLRITYKPAPPRVADFVFSPPTKPELSDLLATLDSARDALRLARSADDKVQLSIAMDNAARRLQQAGDWLASADPHDVDAWLAVNNNKSKPAANLRVLPAVSTPPRAADPPLSLYNPPPFNRVPSLGGRPAVSHPAINHPANFTSGDFGGWLESHHTAPRNASPDCHPITPSSVTDSSQHTPSLPMPIPQRQHKCRTQASTSSSGCETHSDASSVAEGNDMVLATVSPLAVQQAAAQAAAHMGSPVAAGRGRAGDMCASDDQAADCLEAALSGGLSSILFRTPETSPLPSPRMGPLYNMFTESTTVSPMLSPIRSTHTTRW